MFRFFAVLIGLTLAISPIEAAFAENSKALLTDEQIRQKLIQQSIATYPGNCPCPYNAARNGSRCGKRSAWSRPGGYAPLCFSNDVTDKMVSDYRKQHPKE